MLSFFRKKPAPQPVRTPIRIAPIKPVDIRERDTAIDALSALNADLNETEGDIARLLDQKRRLLLSIDGRKAQLDALERPEREAIEKATDGLEAELTIPDVSAAIAEMQEMKEAAE
ncbi:MAG: hypothetical protein H6877_09865 [Rhodobiaceae bacterium]|jgi:hypothetical protein|nr:hypothetical protein [Rhodobiaceae bacterium]